MSARTHVPLTTPSLAVGSVSFTLRAALGGSRARCLLSSYELLTVAILVDHRLEGLKHQEFIVSQFWRPEVQNQGVGKATLPLKALGGRPPLPLPAPGGFRHSPIVAASLFTWPSSLGLWVSDLPVLSLLRTQAIGVRPHPKSRTISSRDP